jgi:hypothetical protein
LKCPVPGGVIIKPQVAAKPENRGVHGFTGVLAANKKIAERGEPFR